MEIIPLPSGAQFLNVIESVFSGMARAIIHNSDYRTVEDAQTAIVRYIDERNSAFRENPLRAGRSIWGKERTASEFLDTHDLAFGRPFDQLPNRRSLACANCVHCQTRSPILASGLWVLQHGTAKLAVSAFR
jgi:hypothetical protein